MAVTISADDINEIKSALGFPLVQGFEWENNSSSDDYIKGYVIPRVLRTYFTYYPIRVDTNTAVNGQFEIAYPNDPDIFRVLRHFFNFKNWSSLQTTSPFFLQALVIGKGSFNPTQDLGKLQTAMSDMTTWESIMDFNRAVEVNDVMDQRVVRGCVSTPGDLTIQWAKKSDDFSAINYSRREDALRLAKGYLLQDAARIRSQVQVQAKAMLETSMLKADGDSYVAEVEGKWKRRGFASATKG